LNVTAQPGLTAVTAVLLILLIAAIFNRVHGEGVNRTGDRVISGLLALPLITIWVTLVLPAANIVWALLAPLPLFLYVWLLPFTSTDERKRLCRENLKDDPFSRTLLVIISSLYIVLAIVVLILYG
jgi:hypothetical protein